MHSITVAAEKWRARVAALAAEYRPRGLVIAVADDEREEMLMNEFQLDQSTEDFNIGCFHWPPQVLTGEAPNPHFGAGPNPGSAQPNPHMQMPPQGPSFSGELKYRLFPPLESFDAKSIRQFLDKFLSGKVFSFFNFSTTK